MIKTLLELKDINAKAIVFDCYGTLIEIKKKTKPYKFLYEKIKEFNLDIPNYAHYVMTSHQDINTIEKKFNISFPLEVKEEFLKKLNIELESIEYFEETQEFLHYLKEKNIKTLICSNLAYPYGDITKKILVDDCVLSYDVGYIKPQQKIFEICKNKLQLNKEDIVFVGDTYKDDYLGAKEYGFNAYWLKREKNE